MVKLIISKCPYCKQIIAPKKITDEEYDKHLETCQAYQENQTALKKRNKVTKERLIEILEGMDID